MSLPSYLVGWLLAFFCFKDAAMAAGGVAVWRWIPTRSSLDGGRRRRGWIQNLEELGRAPGRMCVSQMASYTATPTKACVRWASPVRGGTRFLLRRQCPAATSSCASGSRRFQGSLCIFQFVQSPFRSLVETAVHASFMYVSVFLYVFVLYP